jgi:hypothetical protein
VAKTFTEENRYLRLKDFQKGKLNFLKNQFFPFENPEVAYRKISLKYDDFAPH